LIVPVCIINLQLIEPSAGNYQFLLGTHKVNNTQRINVENERT